MERLKSFKSFRNRAADFAGEENAKELLEAQAHIWNHIFSFINSMSLKCAIELGVFDAIQHGPATPAELASALPVAPAKAPCLSRLLRLLAHSGFLEPGPGGAYGLTGASRLLLRENPLGVSPFLMAVLDPALARPWDRLPEWFGNGDGAAFETAHGETFWAHAGRDRAGLGRFFDEAMASDARLVAGVVVERCGWVFEGVGSLVDVGGGTGTVARAVAEAFPAMECTVFDLPHVVADSRLVGTEGNLNFVGGDMFDSITPGDAILLKWILHDWSDEDSVKILKKCKEAIVRKGSSKKGKVIIIDMMVENEKSDHEDESYRTQLFFDLIMMVLVNGKERDEKEWAKLFQDAGFTSYKITPILGLRSIIEVYP